MIGKEEPRVFTQPLRKLTNETSLGFLFADFCADVCGIALLPWQKWLAIHGLEIVGDLNGDWHFRFRTVIVLVARQNGKSKFLALLNLFFLYVLGCELTIGTAQNLDTANEVWEDAVQIAQDEQELSDGIKAITRGNSGKQLKLKNGERYKVVSANRSAGRGNSADLVSMDELREQLDWKAWGAVTKTTMARPNAQVWGFSNAGDAQSVVLRTLRTKCHAAIGDPDGIAARIGALLPNDEDSTDDYSVGLFEWSARPNCALNDKEQWCQANPSLGYGFLTERALRSAMSTDPEDIFRTECLCQWVEAVIDSAFPDGAWELALDEHSAIADDAELTFGIDVSSERDVSSLAVCGKRADGDWHIEIINCKHGFSWLVDWLRVRAQSEHVRVAYQGRGAPICSHIDDLERIENLELLPCEGGNLGAWTGRFYDSVAAHLGGDAVKVWHLQQPILDHSVKVAQTKPIGDSAWCWNRNTSVDDISTLVAATMAFGAATANMNKEKNAKYESAYEHHSLIVI